MEYRLGRLEREQTFGDCGGASAGCVQPRGCTHAGANGDSQTHSHTYLGADGYAHTGTNSDTDSYRHTYTGANGNAHTGANSDADPYGYPRSADGRA